MRFSDFANAGKAPHGERRKKLVDVLRLNHEKAIRLAPVRCDLGKEFVGRDACGDREPDFLKNLRTDGAGHLRG